MASLLPGYKHVESFGPDSEYEEEEVEYVTLDLGTVEPTLVPSSSSYRLIGLDTPTPFLQLSGTMLKGEHVSLLGTELLFSEASAVGSSSGMNTGVDEQPHERTQGKKTLAHLANTERRIRFKEVELKPKVTGSSSNGEDVGTPTPKTANLAKKVKTQMEHVMSGSAGPSRRGRGRGGGRKRGSTSGKPKASSARSKTRDADQDEEGAPAADSAEKGGEAGQDDNADSAPVQMDTSAG